jgi:hypothetical protein
MQPPDQDPRAHADLFNDDENRRPDATARWSEGGEDTESSPGAWGRRRRRGGGGGRQLASVGSDSLAWSRLLTRSSARAAPSSGRGHVRSTSAAPRAELHGVGA